MKQVKKKEKKKVEFEEFAEFSPLLQEINKHIPSFVLKDFSKCEKIHKKIRDKMAEGYNNKAANILVKFFEDDSIKESTSSKNSDI